MSMLRKFNFSLTLLIVASFFVVGGYAQASVVGDQRKFFVDPSYDKYFRTSLNATLRYISNRTYFYVDDGYWSKLSGSQMATVTNSISSVASEFDNNIYPKEISLWGSEPNPGIDNDSHVVILLEELNDNTGGYFQTGNDYSKSQVSNSNEAEMIYVGTNALSVDIGYVRGFISHEFQHLISFNQKNLAYNLSDDTWLNELRSEYSITVVGYNDNYQNSNLQRRVNTFLGNPSDSLTEWPNNSIDYGIINVFGEYIVEQYGQSILSDSLKSPYVGIDSINHFLVGISNPERFQDIFANWMIATYLNNPLAGNKYSYSRLGMEQVRVSPENQFYMFGQNDYSASLYEKDWQPVWSEFNFSSPTDRALKIDINGEAGQNFIGTYVAFYDSGVPEVGRINMTGSSGVGYVFQAGRKIEKIMLATTDGTMMTNFGATEQAHSLAIKVSLVDPASVKPALEDGVLIKHPIEKEMYVIWGKYKRYLSPDVIALYGQLNPANAIEVGPEVFNSYMSSNYVKYVNDQKVYAVWPDGTKHWLNITPQQWDASGRDWNAIFTISDLELNFYKTGPDITK